MALVSPPLRWIGESYRHASSREQHHERSSRKDHNGAPHYFSPPFPCFNNANQEKRSQGRRSACTYPKSACCLYSLYCREQVFPETCIHLPVYLTVPGRRRAGLISELPRRVLLGNWAAGTDFSRRAVDKVYGY